MSAVVLADVQRLLKNISDSLHPLVVRPKDVAQPASRARYLCVLGKQLTDGEITYRQVLERINEWDRKNPA